MEVDPGLFAFVFAALAIALLLKVTGKNVPTNNAAEDLDDPGYHQIGATWGFRKDEPQD